MPLEDPESLRRRKWIDALYRRYGRALSRFLASRRVGREEAADIVQEAYFRLQQSPHFEDLRNPRAFLFRVAGNVHLNAQKHRRAGVEDDRVDAATLEVEAADPGPYRTLAAEQELAVVRAAIDELPRKCRDAFIMNRFEGLTFVEIAAELELSVSMIEKHVSHAIVFLRARLDEARPAGSRRLRPGGKR